MHWTRVVWDDTPGGNVEHIYIVVVYEVIDDDTVVPVTAYEVAEP